MMTEKQLIHDALKGHADAIACMYVLIEASQTMDDIVDGDKPVSMEQKHALFWNLMVTLPNNPFYLTYAGRLQPVIRSVLNDWFVANRLEHEHGPNHIAYIIRNNLVAVLFEMALIVGGYEHARQYSVAMREYVHGNESVGEYIDEFAREGE